MSLLDVKVGPQTVQVSSKFLIIMNNHIAPPTVCANCNIKLFIPDPPLPYILTPLPLSHLHTHSTLTITHTLHTSTSHTVGLETCREDHHTSQTVWTTNWYETLLLPPPFVPLLPPSSLPPLLLPPPSPHSPSLSPYPAPTSFLVRFSYLLLPVLIVLLIVVQKNVRCVSRGTSGHVVYPMGGTWHSLRTETLLLQKWQVQGVVSSHLSSHNETTSGLILVSSGVNVNISWGYY